MRRNRVEEQRVLDRPSLPQRSIGRQQLTSKGFEGRRHCVGGRNLECDITALPRAPELSPDVHAVAARTAQQYLLQIRAAAQHQGRTLFGVAAHPRTCVKLGLHEAEQRLVAGSADGLARGGRQRVELMRRRGAQTITDKGR